MAAPRLLAALIGIGLVAASGCSSGNSVVSAAPTAEPTTAAVTATATAIANDSESPPSGACATPADCERACRSDDPLSCDRLGQMLESGAGTRHDFGRAMSAFARACDLGTATSCATLARKKAMRGGTGAEVAALAMRACDGGAPFGCVELAKMQRFGLDTPIDPAKAERVEERAATLATEGCEKGARRDCDLLLALRDRGRSVTLDEARLGRLRAAEAADHLGACRKGDLLACDSVATHDILDRPLPGGHAHENDALLRKSCERDVVSACEAIALSTEEDKAGPFSERACKLGSANGCSRLSTPDGEALADEISKGDCEAGEFTACTRRLRRLEKAGGAEATSLAERTRKLAIQICRVTTITCSSAANMLEAGKGGPKDPAQAMDLLELACRSGYCRPLAERLIASADKGAKKRGLALYEAACAAGVDCESLADLYAEGKHVPKNAKRAQEIYAGILKEYERDCAQGDSTSCDLASFYYREGKGVKMDPERARALQKRACDLGGEMACLMAEMDP